MCSTGPFQYRWLKEYIYISYYYHHQIGIIHNSHCFHIFPWLCVWDACYIISCYLLHMNSGNLFSLSLSNLCWVQMVGYGLNILFIYLYITPSHYHHCAKLYEDVELTKCMSDIFVECVSKIRHILPVIPYTICGAVCFQFTHFYCDDWVNIYIYILCLIIIIKSEVWSITHCLG